MKIRISEDPEECRHLWAQTSPDCFFDLWMVREAFAASFQRPPYFIVAESGWNISGLLPLCWIAESQCYGYFPGETWHGRTWLEQNGLRAAGPKVARALLEAVPDAAHLRYMRPAPWHGAMKTVSEDEVGYLFFPGAYGYDFQRYRKEFSGKSRKRLSREISALTGAGLSFRYDHLSDVPVMFRMNLDGFRGDSYFNDPRFLSGFDRLLGRLYGNRMLRITTVLLGGRVAAVDVGAVWNNTYTVLAGGTSPAYPGVAKLINFHHLAWACEKRFDTVDFLCGDFGWKKRFHLTPRQLYEIRLPAPDASEDAPLFQNRACA